jgi:hypothetical protein
LYAIEYNCIQLHTNVPVIQSKSKSKYNPNPNPNPNTSGLPPDEGRVDEDGLFEIFWKAYPRKEAPKVAKIAFEKLKPDKNLLSVMLDWIGSAKLSAQWQDKTKIPHPATWLNQQRWEGDPPPIAASSPPSRASPTIRPTTEYERRKKAQDEWFANIETEEQEVLQA